MSGPNTWNPNNCLSAERRANEERYGKTGQGKAERGRKTAPRKAAWGREVSAWAKAWDGTKTEVFAERVYESNSFWNFLIRGMPLLIVLGRILSLFPPLLPVGRENEA